jgi:hypothetical protein
MAKMAFLDFQSSALPTELSSKDLAHPPRLDCSIESILAIGLSSILPCGILTGVNALD